MEEIKMELENEAKEKHARDERAYQALQAQRARDLQQPEAVPSSGFGKIQTQEVAPDSQSKILDALATA